MVLIHCRLCLLACQQLGQVLALLRLAAVAHDLVYAQVAVRAIAQCHGARRAAQLLLAKCCSFILLRRIQGTPGSPSTYRNKMQPRAAEWRSFACTSIAMQ